MGLTLVSIGVEISSLNLANYIPHSIFTWGMVVWTSLVYFVFYYDVQSLDHAFNACYGTIQVVRLVTMEFLRRRMEM